MIVVIKLEDVFLVATAVLAKSKGLLPIPPMPTPPPSPPLPPIDDDAEEDPYSGT